jgi:hypothetical protein
MTFGVSSSECSTASFRFSTVDVELRVSVILQERMRRE